MPRIAPRPSALRTPARLTRPPSPPPRRTQVDDSEYEEFYKSISKDFDAPLAWTHFRAEGEIEFKSILFIPKRMDPGAYENYYGTSSALKLYVRKVLIQASHTSLFSAARSPPCSLLAGRSPPPPPSSPLAFLRLLHRAACLDASAPSQNAPLLPTPL